MTPQDFLRMLALRWPLVIVFAIVGAGVGWITTPEDADSIEQQTAVYRATNISFLVLSEDDARFSPAQIAFFATFDDVPAAVADRLDGDADQLAAQVQVTPNQDLGILRITATSQSAELAELIADTFAVELARFLADQGADEQTRRQEFILDRVDAAETRIRELDGDIFVANPTEAEILTTERDTVVNQLRLEQERLQDLRSEGTPNSVLRRGRDARAIAYRGPEALDLALRMIGVTDGATPESEDPEATDPYDALRLSATTANDPDPVTRALFGGIAGAAVALALIALLTRFDAKIRTKAGAEEAFGLPVLVDVPSLRHKTRQSLIVVDHPETKAAESYRALRTALSLSKTANHLAGTPAGTEERDVNVLMVSAPRAGAGATTVAANLAAALAEASLNVLLVDCDFRSPSVHSFYDAEFADPVSTFTGGRKADLWQFIAKTGIEGVSVALTVSPVDTSTTSTPSALISLQREFIESVQSRFDVVILDTAPSLDTNDAFDILPVADAVIFAARTSNTNQKDAAVAIDAFEWLAAPMAGVVLLNSDGSTNVRRPEFNQYSMAQRQHPAENGTSQKPATVET